MEKGGDYQLVLLLQLIPTHTYDFNFQIVKTELSYRKKLKIAVLKTMRGRSHLKNKSIERISAEVM